MNKEDVKMETPLLCKEFFEVISSNSQSIRSRLVVAPDQPSCHSTSNFLFARSQNHIEIICFKSTFLRIFKEAHDYLLQFHNDAAIPRNENSYYASIGLLLTTPENRTALNIHEDFIRYKVQDTHELYTSIEEIPDIFIANEFLVLKHLLGSSNNRINKSSSLWLLYKKLYVLMQGSFPSLSFDYFSVCMTSAEQHPSNYYCWNTVRWLSDLASPDKRTEFLVRTKQFCFQNLKDSSSWYTYAYLLCPPTDSVHFTKEEYMRLRKRYNLENQVCQTFTPRTEESIIREIIDIKTYIDKIQVCEWPPYVSALHLSHHLLPTERNKIFEEWREEVSKFEKAQHQIGSNMFLTHTSQEYEDDLLLKITIQCMNYKQRFLRYLNIDRGQ